MRREEEEERNCRRDSSLTLGIRLASVSLPSPSSWTVFVQTCVVLSSLPMPPWSIRTKTLKRGHLAEAAPPMTSNLGSRVQVHLGTSRDRVGPGFTEVLGTGSGPRQAPGAPAPLAASCHFLLRFLDLPGGQLPGPVNQALQNATHLDRTGESLSLRGGHCGAGVKGQPGPSLLRVLVPFQVSRKMFIRAEL